MISKFLLPSFSFLLLFLFGCADSGSPNGTETSESVGSNPNSDVIVFGAYTADKASDVVEEFAPTINWLESEVSAILGRPIEIRMKIANSYLAGISDIAIGKAHFSRLGPASYIHAADENPGLEILAMESKKGERTFKGLIVVHKDSSIKNLADLRGKSFAFGSPLSTIGRYLVQDLLISNDIYSSDLSNFAYLGRHDSVGMAVAAEAFDAGALKSSSFKALIKEGYPVKQLLSFDNVTKPWVAHPNLDPEIFSAIRQAMLNIRPEQAKVLDIDGFLESGPEYYDNIGEAMKRAKHFDDTAKITSQ
ncbi:MAG: PhnD/SsuA/transferrin family substrate-binding protein [Verrucomicrobiales bacterium]|nr:PhnD/SsuA/transferrin family substrate-binding protein [Verrucomicrobiales bacterium]